MKREELFFIDIEKPEVAKPGSGRLYATDDYYAAYKAFAAAVKNGTIGELETPCPLLCPKQRLLTHHEVYNQFVGILDKPIIIVDCESDGLWGEVFAVGAIHYDPAGEINEFYAAHLGGVKNQWVCQNVIPHLEETHPSRGEVYWEFFKWGISHNWKTKKIVANIPFPVEVGLFIRLGYSPEIYDTATMLWQLGLGTSIDTILDKKGVFTPGKEHHPLNDARRVMQLLTILFT